MSSINQIMKTLNTMASKNVHEDTVIQLDKNEDKLSTLTYSQPFNNRFNPEKTSSHINYQNMEVSESGIEKQKSPEDEHSLPAQKK